MMSMLNFCCEPDPRIIKMNQSYIKKRLLSLFETKKMSDCTFLIENEEISTHKLILATCSPVFEAMLYGPLASSKIVIHGDITAIEFKQMLTFIYTDSVQIKSIINAWALVYVAKKYLIDDLLEYCLYYIKTHMDVTNVLLNYEYSELFNEESIRKMCENVVQMYTKLVFRFEYHIKPDTLCFVMEQNDLNATEEELFEIAVKWAKIECEMQDLMQTQENIKFVLLDSGVLSRFRFLSLPQNAFSDNNIYLEVLTNEDIDLLKSFLIDESPENKLKLRDLQFSLNKNPRKNLPLFPKMAIRQIYKTGTTFNPNFHSKLSTQIEANKLILVNGFCISPHRKKNNFVSDNYEERLKIRITNNVTKEVIGDFHVNKFINCGDIHTIKTPQPIIFEKGEIYNIDVFWTDEVVPRSLEYPMYYMAPKCEGKDISFQFTESLDCGIIQGVCYYPI